MEANRAKHLRHQANLLKAIKDSGGVRSLFEELKEVEAKIDRIDEILVNSEKKVVQEISIEEVREFVNTQAGSFEELLMGSAESVKHEFRKRITAITLTPILDARGLVYIVTGDVDLFTSPPGAMQTNKVGPDWSAIQGSNQIRDCSLPCSHEVGFTEGCIGAVMALPPMARGLLLARDEVW